MFELMLKIANRKPYRIVLNPDKRHLIDWLFYELIARTPSKQR